MREKETPQPERKQEKPEKFPFRSNRHVEQVPQELFERESLEQGVPEKDPLLEELPGEETGKGN